MTSPAEQHRRAGLLHDDAHEIDRVAAVADGFHQIVAQHQTDRFGIRLIRPLFHPNGSPILNDRGEQRRAILAGVFLRDYIQRAAELVVELNTRPADDPRDRLGLADAVGAWHAYVHIQQVGAPAINRLLPGNQGTVCTAGIDAYRTLIADIDPEDGAAPGVALEVAWDLVDVLVDTVGVPRRAICVMQSGRGGYVLVNLEPQPLSARPVMQLATRTLARMIEAAEEPAHGDESVFDPPRTLRAPGSINHKPSADPTTPAWILQRWTPGVRTPWAIVEKIAAKSRPTLRVVPRSPSSSNSSGVARRPLRDLFVERGWLYRERADGVGDVKCPNSAAHTDGRDAAILYPPTHPGGPGWLKCSHAHCASLTLFDVFRLLEGRA